MNVSMFIILFSVQCICNYLITFCMQMDAQLPSGFDDVKCIAHTDIHTNRLTHALLYMHTCIQTHNCL